MNVGATRRRGLGGPNEAFFERRYDGCLSSVCAWPSLASKLGGEPEPAIGCLDGRLGECVS